MNDNLSILLEIKSIVRNIIGDDSIEIELQTVASDVNGWDSLAHITIVISIEQHYSIKFSLTELQNIKEISGLVDLVKSKAKLS
tara:strand:- start:1556 stop:1807 length:252 start_codon:yes stop_codon:yes gene_type:complete